MGPKNPHLTHFGNSKSFSQIKILSLFCVYGKLQKNNELIHIETRYIEMGKRTDGRADPRTDQRTDRPSGNAEV